MASQDWFDKDFYKVLGVSKDVSDADLKKTYRKLARTYHPDQAQGDAAESADDDAATRAIPAQRKTDADAATEKLNTRPDDEAPRRGGGGLSAQDLLRREGLVSTTAQMQAYVERERPERVALITECSMSDNVAAEHPDVDFVRPCNLCPHMKRNTLTAIRRSLELGQHEITLDPTLEAPARRAIERMLAVK